jgi:uncharacterized membrane protein YfhO
VFPSANGAARVTDYRETTNTISFRVEVPGEKATLAASVVADGGWSGRDEHNGVLTVFRKNGPFLAVTVPRGIHTVQLRYAPPGLRTGLVISLLTALAALLAALRSARARGREASVISAPRGDSDALG